MKKSGEAGVDYLLLLGGAVLIGIITISIVVQLAESGIVGVGQSMEAFDDIFSGEPQAPIENVRFIHMTDTHIITGGSCGPSLSSDGRTDCISNLVNFTEECSTGVCQWIDPVSGMSLAPTIALQDAVALANTYNPDFTVVTGDLVAYMGCDQDKIEAFDLFESIMDNSNSNYFVTGALFHDQTTDPNCLNMYENTFGAGMVNWDFVLGDNLFVGLSEVNSVNDRFDTFYLNTVLDTYKNQDKKLFLFFHTQVSCYDEIYQEGKNFRCNAGDDVKNTIDAHKDEYRAVLIFGGHNHANIYEEKNGIHHFTTSATMNYPTEFRVIDITPDTVDVFPSTVINSDIHALSYEIINNSPQSYNNPLIFFGLPSDRAVLIDLSGS